MQRAAVTETDIRSIFGRRLQKAAAIISMLLLCAVPLTFLTAVHRFYTLPRFVLLVTGSTVLAAILALMWVDSRRGSGAYGGEFKTRHVFLLAVYVMWVGCSTAFGVAPVVSLLGSFENQMGWLTHLCFFVCFLGIIAGVSRSTARLEILLWVMTLTALIVAVYGVAQFFGIDPFISPILYTSKAGKDSLIRIASTIGHADYLGNFLLYTTWTAFALALVSSGRTRRIALAASLLIITAIVCSGTRGAWVGLIAGAIMFAFLEVRSARNLLVKRKWVPVAATAFILVIAFGLLVASNPASNSIILRAKSFITDGATGSGRTVLWRDAVKMVPAFAIRGCGPEGFRKAFLPYKSNELARLAPHTNNESSHNAYLDAAISYGLLGLVLYVAVITSTFYLLFSAYRRTTEKSFRVIISGLLASYAGVIIHNIFIFDQISTGLYFFAMAAIAQIVLNVTKYKSGIHENGIHEGDINKRKNSPRPVRSSNGYWQLWATTALGGALVSAAIWYCVGLMIADVEIKRAFASAEAGNLEKTLKSGERATLQADPTRAYDFLFAQAITVCVDRLGLDSVAAGRLEDRPDSAAAARDRALQTATAYANRSLARTMTPDSNYLLLAYISRLAGNIDDLESFAAKAVEWDGKFSNARWLMAEAYLARGLNDEAAREARIGLELNPFSRQLTEALKEARQSAKPKAQLVKSYIKRGEAAAKRGNTKKARRMIARAADLADGPCPECHRSLALLYEKASRYDEAINEWRIYIKESSSHADAETDLQETDLHLKELMQKKADSSKTAKQGAQ
jgi:O-antigen ligase/tetratricopeptide (TPR) repeat protein